MPLTLTGLALVLAVIPGFLYVSVNEARYGPRKRSGFRESMLFVTVSVTVYAVALLSLVIVGQFDERVGKVVLAALTGPFDAWRRFPVDILGLILVVFLVGLGLAGISGHLPLPRVFPVAEQGSAWWRAFRSDVPKGHYVFASAHLKDLRVLQGYVYSYSRDEQGDGNRELVLSPPLWEFVPGLEEPQSVNEEFMLIPEREIEHISVVYHEYPMQRNERDGDDDVDQVDESRG